MLVFGAVRRLGAVAAAAVLLTGCQSFLPYANDARVPTPVVVADGSAERAALNSRVYDSAVNWVGQRFYKRDFGGIDWRAETAARRESAVAQPTERDFYRALNETLNLLGDRHTNAVTPTRNRERALERLEPTPNLGFAMRRVDGQLIVTSIRPGGPADLARVQLGWRADRLNGEPVSLTSSLRKDLDIQVVLFTDGQEVEHEVSIPVVPLPPYLGDAERRADGVLVLSFDRFAPATRRWFDDQMRAAAVDPPKGIVIDLRDNSGGFITDVGRALAHFFPDRQPYAWIDVGYLPRFPYRTRPPRDVWTGPVAVVIGDGSVSGAEAFAATFQETGRGPVFGLKSMGAVVASRDLLLPDGGELGIGVRSFRSGAGAVLEGVGVTPDHEVRFRADELRQGRDAMIEAAAEAVLARP
ncbi:MAG: S41 family peptidase [Pseudomonadota bacterium]|nr:S41 family peptidase [Pseudomonadota bacterium]